MLVFCSTTELRSLNIYCIHNVLFAEIDECAEGTHNCEANATCVNEPGTYRCICGDGFIVDGDRCIGKQSDLNFLDVLKIFI